MEKPAKKTAREPAARKRPALDRDAQTESQIAERLTDLVEGKWPDPPAPETKPHGDPLDKQFEGKVPIRGDGATARPKQGDTPEKRQRELALKAAAARSRRQPK